MNNLEKDKQGLIDLIIWYRDEYHHGDWCHSELIERVKNATTYDHLDPIYQIVDGWID